MVSPRSGSSKTLWKSGNSQVRRNAIEGWNGHTIYKPDTVKILLDALRPDTSNALPVTVDYMYEALRRPLCAVAADKETKERLRKIAFAMHTVPREKVPRTQRDRLVRLLTRLTGGKHANRNAASRRESKSCGFDPSYKYRLITDAEMNLLGFTSSVGTAGKYKFFYKAKRAGLWSKDEKKYRVREYKAPPPQPGKNGRVPASKPLRVPQRIVQRGLQANARNAAAPWIRNTSKWSGSARSGGSSGVWKDQPAPPNAERSPGPPNADWLRDHGFSPNRNGVNRTLNLPPLGSLPSSPTSAPPLSNANLNAILRSLNQNQNSGRRTNTNSGRTISLRNGRRPPASPSPSPSSRNARAAQMRAMFERFATNS